MIFVTETQLINGCWGSGSIYSAVISILVLALLAGAVALVYLYVYGQWKNMTKK
ncbi:hypothetical protein [Methanocella conradii]|uniref:hypothetical protein n=1 Tax=Methanocella conradii TaxID=1175444 RepID=UPI0024B3A5DB|nr:hypothetical protein [Methanocella conradii]MDI6895821.1 hypothetical protein [Methanocella conradii]